MFVYPSRVHLRGFAVLIAFFTMGAPHRSFATESAAKDLLAVVNQYYAALEAKSISELEKSVDSNLIVLEGTYKNLGWSDYRDHHIGPEMKEWKSFKTRDRKVVRVEASGGMGYVIEELEYEIALPNETVKMAGAETFVLVKTQKGWKIKHVHTSAKVVKP